MGCVSFTLAGIEDHDLVVSAVAEDTGPLLFHCAVQPHEFVLGSTLDLSIILGVEGLEFVLEGLAWLLGGDEDDAKSALSGEADVLSALVVQLGDYINKIVQISVIHCLVADESRELPPPGTKTSE